jgi:hypothetical protein
MKPLRYTLRQTMGPLVWPEKDHLAGRLPKDATPEFLAACLQWEVEDAQAPLLAVDREIFDTLGT